MGHSPTRVFFSIVAPRYYKYPLSDSLPLPKCTARELFFPNLKEKQHLAEKTNMEGLF